MQKWGQRSLLYICFKKLDPAGQGGANLGGVCPDSWGLIHIHMGSFITVLSASLLIRDSERDDQGLLGDSHVYFMLIILRPHLLCSKVSSFLSRRPELWVLVSTS